MPRIRTWHRISHDFTDDPEVWELRKQFGDWTIMVWLRMLATADRNGGKIRGPYDRLYATWASLSGHARTTKASRTVRDVVTWMSQHGWIEVTETHILICNYATYRQKGERNVSPRGTATEPPTRLDNTTTREEEHTTQDNPTTGGVTMGGDWPSAVSLQGLWNERKPEALPAILIMSPARVDRAMTALQISPDRAFWETVMDEIEASDFLSGRTPSRERPDWRLTLDYLLTTNRKTGVEMAVMIHDGAFRARARFPRASRR